jgi:CheY-like chemotaxis protein
MSEFNVSLSPPNHFFQKIGEDVRATLQVLISKVRNLHKENFSETELDELQKVSLSSQELTRLLNNIVQLSKLHTGNIELQKSDFSLQHCIELVHQQFISKSHAKNIQFTIRFASSLEPVFLGDRELIHHAISNLLHNAIYYTQKGCVSISVDVIKNTLTHQFIRIQVSDTGCGMSSEKIAELIHSFENPSTSQLTDDGIGFALTQAIVHLMGGKITIRSKENEGTTFALFIEWEKGNSTRLNSVEIDSVKGKFRGKKILLVEDNDMNRFVAMQSLIYAGCEVYEAINGQEALKVLETNTFDAILMDIQMPIMDGLEATNYIRKTLGLTVPIIAHTANTFVQDIDTYLSNGMNDFISKPYNEELFYKKMSRYLAT